MPTENRLVLPADPREAYQLGSADERERWIAALTRLGNAGGYQQMAQAQAIIMEVAGAAAAGIEIVREKRP